MEHFFGTTDPVLLGLRALWLLGLALGAFVLGNGVWEFVRGHLWPTPRRR